MHERQTSQQSSWQTKQQQMYLKIVNDTTSSHTTWGIYVAARPAAYHSHSTKTIAQAALAVPGGRGVAPTGQKVELLRGSLVNPVVPPLHIVFRSYTSLVL